MKPYLVTPLLTDLLDEFFVQVENAVGSVQVASRDILSTIVFDQAARFYATHKTKMDTAGMTVAGITDIYMSRVN